MKLLYNFRWHSILITVCGMLVLSACVNEEYDLSKEIDTEMTLLKNVSMPLGSIEKISIADILTLEEDGGSVVSKNSDGDFIFSFAGEEISAEIEVPSFSIAPASGIRTEPIEVHFSTGSAAGLSPDLITEDIVYSEITGKLLSAAMDIDIDTELPAQIKDIRSVGLDASVYINFAVNSGAVNLKEGFVLEFPAFLNIKKSMTSDSRFELVDNHKLIMVEDVKISSASPLTFALELDKINVPSGAIKNGSLVLNEDVRVSGDFYLSPSDFSVIPEKIVIDIKAEITDLDVVSAEVKLSLDEEISGSTVAIDNIPEFLAGEGVYLDIYNPSLTFDITNSSPFSFGVKAGITANRGTKEVSLTLGEDPEINIPAESSVKFMLTRREQASGGISYIVAPELGEMISMLPETISIDNISLASADEGYVEIRSGSRYQASIAYEVYAPLAFGEKLEISFDQDIENLGIDLGVGVPSICASLKIENSVPLEFAISALALDSAGNVMNDMEVSVSKPVAAGTQTSPATTEVDLTIRSRSGSISFDGLRLALNAAASSTVAGVALNENQGFVIKDLVISLPDGISISDTENE